MEQIKWLSITFIALTVSACSSINSVQPFDRQQAAKLVQQDHTQTPTQQMIKIALPHKNAWQRVDMSMGTVGTPIMLIPKDESMDHWTQSVRTKMAAYRNDPQITANQFVQNEIGLAKERCGDVESEVISRTKESVVYRLDVSDCRNEKDQKQIGKALVGSDAVYVVYYSAARNTVDVTQWTQMSQMIKTAQLVRNPKHVTY